MHRVSSQDTASGAGKGIYEGLSQPGRPKVDSQGHLGMTPVSEGLLRVVWRARGGIRTISGSPPKVVIRATQSGREGPPRRWRDRKREEPNASPAGRPDMGPQDEKYRPVFGVFPERIKRLVMASGSPEGLNSGPRIGVPTGRARITFVNMLKVLLLGAYPSGVEMRNTG